MTRRPKQAAKLSPVAMPLQKKVKPRSRLTNPLRDKAKSRPQQKRKPMAVKADQSICLTTALNYLSNYLLLLYVSAIILALAYWFRGIFEG
jgi:hypothetical protein